MGAVTIRMNTANQTPTEYTENAQRTTAAPSPELMERLCDPRTLALFAYIGGKAISQSEAIDGLKRHIFYGKPLSVDVSMPTPADHEAIQRRLCNPDMVKIIHGIIGMVTESGELLHSLLAHLFQDEPLDRINIMEELGDSNWYQAEVMEGIKTDWEAVWEKNIDKLVARYGEAFSEHRATERDLVNERKVLEGK